MDGRAYSFSETSAGLSVGNCHSARGGPVRLQRLVRQRTLGACRLDLGFGGASPCDRTCTVESWIRSRRYAPAVVAGFATAYSVAFPILAWGTPSHCKSGVDMLETAAVPATAEWTAWIGSGAAARDAGTGRSRVVFAARAGAGVSFNLGSFRMLRLGPWVGAETQLDGVLGEGGLEVLFSPRTPAYWGTYSFRFGGAYGTDELGPSRQISLTLTGGTRSAPVWEQDVCVDVPPRTSSYSHGIRLFVTVRISETADRGTTLLGGLEIDPSLFFPPYLRDRWLGPSYDAGWRESPRPRD